MKAQGLSINTIIIAVLGLLILVVLIFISTGKLGDFRTSVEQCGSGICEETSTACEQRGMAAEPKKCDADAPKQTKYCCIPFGDSNE